ncbi:MAG: Yip1 family protein [Candidatus Aenigmatarchaeota archaeon]
MCFKTLKSILTNPAEAISKAKKSKNVSETLWILFLSFVMIGAGLSIVSLGMFTAVVSAAVGITILLLGSLFSAFLGYLLSIVMNILGGKGKVKDGLAVVSYSIFPISIAVLVTALLSMIHPTIGFLGFILMAVQTALGFSIYFRAVKELFKTDMVRVLIGFLIMIYVIMISAYLTLAISSSTVLPFFSEMMMPLGLA